MKRFIQFGMGITVGVVIAVLLIPSFVGAAGFKVGVIDLQKAIEAHPSYQPSLTTFEQFKTNQMARLNEYRNLTSLTDADKDAIVALRADIDEKIAAKYDELFNPLTQEVIDAVKQVGMESGIEVIIDSQVVLYGGMSLTPAVIQALGG